LHKYGQIGFANNVHISNYSLRNAFAMELSCRHRLFSLQYSKLIWHSCIILMILCVPYDALARAGGAGAGGHSSSLLGLILAPFFIIYSGILLMRLRHKNKQCRRLLSEISQNDSFWDADQLRTYAEEAFFKLQEAWSKRDQEIARPYMTDRLFSKHKSQTDMMIQNNEKNILSNIDIRDMEIISVEDYEDNDKDSFWMFFCGSMIDYVINDKSSQVLRGSQEKAESFKEAWRFIRHSNVWKVDEIKSKITMHDLAEFKIHAEL
jgi:hypothetical protein